MVSCGIDVESLPRMRRLTSRGHMPLSLFGPKERERIDSDDCAAHAFVAKEAILKALGVGWFNTDIDPHEVALTFGANNLPNGATFSGAAKARVSALACGDHSLEFFRLGENLLAFCVFHTPGATLLRRSLVAICRHGRSFIDLYSGSALARNVCIHEPCASTRSLGHLAVMRAVAALGAGEERSVEGAIVYGLHGAPRWLPSPRADAESPVNVAAIAITHNRHLACGAAVGA